MSEALIVLNGEKMAVTKSQLFSLAKSGKIERKTIVEIGGKSYFAEAIKGIEFVDPPKPDSESVPPIYTEKEAKNGSETTPDHPVFPTFSETDSQPFGYHRPAVQKTDKFRSFMETFAKYDYLDLRFRYYVTPILLMIVWPICILVIIGAIFYTQFVGLSPEVRVERALRRAAQESSRTYDAEEETDSSSFEWVSKFILRMVIFIAQVITGIVLLIVVRVILETCLVVFRFFRDAPLKPVPPKDVFAKG